MINAPASRAPQNAHHARRLGLVRPRLPADGPHRPGRARLRRRLLRAHLLLRLLTEPASSAARRGLLLHRGPGAHHRRALHHERIPPEDHHDVTRPRPGAHPSPAGQSHRRRPVVHLRCAPGPRGRRRGGAALECRPRWRHLAGNRSGRRRRSGPTGFRRPARPLRPRLRDVGEEPGRGHPAHHRRDLDSRGHPHCAGQGHLPLRAELAAQRRGRRPGRRHRPGLRRWRTGTTASGFSAGGRAAWCCWLGAWGR